MKAKLSTAAILSTSAIACGVLLASATSTEACMMKQRYQKTSWLQSPWVAVITLPGIALAATLARGGRSYQE
ncbi:MAG TPA: hypothetical protein V6D12_13150 [Candidatus Obscuribacterales bacterium]